MTVRPDDPTGSYVHSWAVPTPAGDWNYQLDDWGIWYGPGWWPFHRYLEHPGTASSLQPTSIRVSPDTAYQSWGNEYVQLRPSPEVSTRIDARLHLYVRPQGLAAIVADTRITLDLKQRATTIDTACPPSLRVQAETKAARLLQFVLDHRAARRRGTTTPSTAHDRWISSTQQHRSTTEAPR